MDLKNINFLTKTLRLTWLSIWDPNLRTTHIRFFAITANVSSAASRADDGLCSITFRSSRIVRFVEAVEIERGRTPETAESRPLDGKSRAVEVRPDGTPDWTDELCPLCCIQIPDERDELLWKLKKFNERESGKEY